MKFVDIPGVFRPTTRREAVQRATAMAGTAGGNIRYRLSDHQGGRSPHAPDCASHWTSAVMRREMATADCSGFVAWCLGYDRYQPDLFSTYGGWVSVDSAIIDARTSRQWFDLTEKPQAGDLIAYPSIDVNHDGSRDRVGHIGMVVETAGAMRLMQVAHCSKGNDRRIGRAIAATDGTPWAASGTYKGMARNSYGAVFLSYKRFAG